MILNYFVFLSTTGFHKHLDVTGLYGISYLKSLWVLFVCFYILQTVSGA